MADYAARIEAAEFPQRVASIRAKLDSFPPEYLPIIDREDDGILERMQSVLDHVLVVTSSVTSELIPKVWISDLVEDLTSIEAALSGLEGLDEDTITVPLVNALTNAVEETAKELMAWPLQPASGDWRDIVTLAASTYRRSLGQQVGQVSQEISALGEEVRGLREQIDAAEESHRDALAARHDDLAKQISNLETQLEGLESQRASVEGQLSRSIERADQAISNQQQQFSEAQEQRAASFRTEVADLINENAAELQNAKSSADARLQELRVKLEEASNLVSVFAAAGTANAYSKEAKEQGDKADNWRLAAIILGVLSGIAASTVLLGVSNGDEAWQLLIGKLAISVTFGGLAGYAARQSARHRRREEAARHLELNLATFGSLAEDLDAEALGTARAELVAAMLHRDEAGTGRPGEQDVIGESQVNLLQRIVEMIVKQRA